MARRKPVTRGGVIAGVKKKLGIKTKPPRPKVKPKPKASYPAGGYANPKPRKKRLDQAGQISRKKK